MLIRSLNTVLFFVSLAAGSVKSGRFPASTKTAYETSKRLQNQALHIKANVPAGYELVGLSLLLRHGTRYPSFSKMQKWNNIMGSLQKQLPDDAPDWLANWSSRMLTKNAWLLNEVGWGEHRSLAINFKSLNPQIFNKFTVVSSFKARCVSSARAFLSGLKDEAAEVSSFEADVDHEDFNGEEGQISYMDSEIKINSKLLRFYDYCRKYVEWVDDHPRSINEFNKFVNGGHISNIRKKIQQKFDIQNLSNKQIVDLFQLTTFENALFGDSAMNKMFETTEDREVLEYLGDLKHYYKTSYGFYINYGQATPLLAHMIEIVERFKNDPTAEPCAKLYFGHAETVVPLISLLGLFEGPPLTAEGFLLSKHRSFRSSAIVPYSSNIGFLIYRKLDSNSDSDMPEMLLQISVNEHLVNIPGQQHTVNIDIALNHFKSKIKEWDNDNCQTTQEYKRPTQDEL